MLALVVFGVSFSVRLYQLSKQSFDCEEMYTIPASTGHHYRYQTRFHRFDVTIPIQEYRNLLSVEPGKGLSEIVDVLKKNVHLPLYFYSMHYWIRLFGTSEWALRFPSAVFGALASLMMFLLGTQLFDRFVGFFSAMLMGLMPDQIYYSQEARMYSLVVLLAVSSTYAMILAKKRPTSIWPYIVYAILSIAGLYTHYVYFACFAVQCVFLWASGYWQKDRMSSWLITQAVVVLGFLPWLFVGLAQERTASGTLSWIHGELSYGLMARELVSKITTLVSTPDIRFGFLTIIAGYGLILLGVLRLRSDRPSLLLLGLWIGLPPVGILILDRALGTEGISVVRYWLVITPALYLLMSAGLQMIRKDRLRIAVASLVILFLFAFAVRTADGKLRHKPDEHRELVHFIEDQVHDRNELVLTEGSPAFPLAFAYYAESDMKVWQINSATNSEQSFREALQATSKVWLLASSRSYAAKVLEAVGFHSIGAPIRFGHILVFQYATQGARLRS